MKEPTEKEIVAFDHMAHKAATLHVYSWCVKRQWQRYTAGLKGQECLNCGEFVMNGGICDPI